MKSAGVGTRSREKRSTYSFRSFKLSNGAPCPYLFAPPANASPYTHVYDNSGSLSRIHQRPSFSLFLCIVLPLSPSSLTSLLSWLVPILSLLSLSSFSISTPRALARSVRLVLHLDVVENDQRAVDTRHRAVVCVRACIQSGRTR